MATKGLNYKVSFDGKTIVEKPAHIPLGNFLRLHLDIKQVITTTFTMHDLCNGASMALTCVLNGPVYKTVEVRVGLNLIIEQLTAPVDAWGGIMGK